MFQFNSCIRSDFVGKTIFITVDNEDTIKDSLKEKLMNLNTTTADNNEDMSSRINYIVRTSDDYVDVQDFVNASMQDTGTMENSTNLDNIQVVENPQETVVVENTATFDNVLQSHMIPGSEQVGFRDYIRFAQI